jgi:hypothetical protein
MCCCGYQGRIDGLHWLTECDRGPTREVRARAAAELRSVGADLLAPAEKVPQATLRAIEQAARVLCGRPGRGRATSSAELPPPDPAAAPAWCAAVLTACGGMPHPGREGIHQAYARLPKGEREAGGDKVSKEATLRAAVDRRLHRFWAALAPSFDAFILELKATRARSAGTAFAYDVSPESAPLVARDEARAARRVETLRRTRRDDKERAESERKARLTSDTKNAKARDDRADLAGLWADERRAIVETDRAMALCTLEQPTRPPPPPRPPPPQQPLPHAAARAAMPPPPPRRARPRQQQAAPEQPRLTLREFRRRLGPLDRRRVRREAAQAAREAERAALAAGAEAGAARALAREAERQEPRSCTLATGRLVV